MTSQRYSTLVTDERGGSRCNCRCDKRSRCIICVLLLLLVVFLILLIADPTFYGIGNSDDDSDSSNSSHSHSDNHPNSNTNSSNNNNNPTNNSIPTQNDYFLTHEHVDSSFISKISKFRSGVGHDYSTPSNESCRSMKHYFNTKTDLTQSIRLYSPCDGIITKLDSVSSPNGINNNNNNGYQVGIQSKYFSDYTIILFHVDINMTHDNTTNGDSDGDSDSGVVNGQYIKFGDDVIAGQIIGTLLNGITSSDIAIVKSNNGNSADGNLLSLFSYINNDIFDVYHGLGITNRSEMIITKEKRDEYRLNCTNRGLFVNNTNWGIINNWVNLGTGQ